MAYEFWLWVLSSEFHHSSHNVNMKKQSYLIPTVPYINANKDDIWEFLPHLCQFHSALQHPLTQCPYLIQAKFLPILPYINVNSGGSFYPFYMSSVQNSGD